MNNLFENNNYHYHVFHQSKLDDWSSQAMSLVFNNSSWYCDWQGYRSVLCHFNKLTLFKIFKEFTDSRLNVLNEYMKIIQELHFGSNKMARLPTSIVCANI